jgi:hypothetical protein
VIPFGVGTVGRIRRTALPGANPREDFGNSPARARRPTRGTMTATAPMPATLGMARASMLMLSRNADAQLRQLTVGLTVGPQCTAVHAGHVSLTTPSSPAQLTDH